MRIIEQRRKLRRGRWKNYCPTKRRRRNSYHKIDCRNVVRHEILRGCRGDRSRGCMNAKNDAKQGRAALKALVGTQPRREAKLM